MKKFKKFLKGGEKDSNGKKDKDDDRSKYGKRNISSEAVKSDFDSNSDSENEYKRLPLDRGVRNATSRPQLRQQAFQDPSAAQQRARNDSQPAGRIAGGGIFPGLGPVVSGHRVRPWIYI